MCVCDVHIYVHIKTNLLLKYIYTKYTFVEQKYFKYRIYTQLNYIHIYMHFKAYQVDKPIKLRFAV